MRQVPQPRCRALGGAVLRPAPTNARYSLRCQASLVATISFDRATICGVIDRLEHKGLVARVVSAQDRRARLLHVMPEGAQLQAASRPVVQALQAEILSPLSPAERSVFPALARKALGLG